MSKAFVMMKRKLIVSMNITLDGYIADANGGLDWHSAYWNEDIGRYATAQLADAGTLLLGRVTYTAMAAYWQQRLQNLHCHDSDLPFAQTINHCEKLVYSKTLRRAGWQNSRVSDENLSSLVLQLKQQPRKDVLVYGSITLVSELMRLRLIDEFVWWIHPVVLGRGRCLFQLRQSVQEWRLQKSQAFSTGVVLLHYQLQGEPHSF